LLWHRYCVFGAGAGKREHEAERVFAIQVEAVQTLLWDEAEGGVQRECGRVVILGLERNLLMMFIVSFRPYASCQGQRRGRGTEWNGRPRREGHGRVWWESGGEGERGSSDLERRWGAWGKHEERRWG
jgi:hypothetical protein